MTEIIFETFIWGDCYHGGVGVLIPQPATRGWWRCYAHMSSVCVNVCVWTKQSSDLEWVHAESPSPPAAPSHGLPPLSKHIVDELGHGLGAAVAPAVCSVLEVLHHLPDELGEEIGDILVAFCRRDLLEVAAVLLSQAAALIFAHLAGVTQVLLVAHQTHRNLCVPATEAWWCEMQVIYGENFLFTYLTKH